MKRKTKTPKLPKLTIELTDTDLRAEEILKLVARKVCFHEDERYVVAFVTMQSLSEKTVSWNNHSKARVEIMDLLGRYFDFKFKK